MGELKSMTTEQLAYSYAHWWREAGLDCATDEAPRRWRDGETVPFWRQAREMPQQPEALARPTPPPVSRSAPPSASARPAPARTPNTLPAFLEALADPSQPEAEWHGALIPPPALDAPRVLLLVEMPAIGAVDHDSLLESGHRRLANAMLAALGLSPEDAPCVSLATRPAPGGHMDDQVLALLGDRMKRYLSFVRPRTLVVLGDRASRALIGDNWRPGQSALEKIDLPGGSVDIVPLAALDLLMNRPAAKARSWKNLRSLHGQLNQ